MPKDKCCGCIELRTGCLIIAYFELIFAIVVIGLCIVGVTLIPAIATEKNSHDQNAGISNLGFIVMLLVVYLISLPFTIVLFVGLLEHKRGHIKVYMIYAVVFLVIKIIMCFVGAITVRHVSVKMSPALMSWYVLLVIRRYYYKMDEKQPAEYSAAEARGRGPARSTELPFSRAIPLPPC